MKYKYIRWAIRWPLLFIIGLLGRFLSPFVTAPCFVVRTMKEDTVKRLGKISIALPREDLVWWLNWFATDDNHVDEYWYGCYDNTRYVSQAYYDSHMFYRWYCRMKWLNRNSMYTFNRKFFGLAKSSEYAWQYKAIKPLWFGYNNDINIGYKAHDGIDRLMYAGRVLGVRKNNETTN